MTFFFFNNITYNILLKNPQLKICCENVIDVVFLSYFFCFSLDKKLLFIYGLIFGLNNTITKKEITLLIKI